MPLSRRSPFMIGLALSFVGSNITGAELDRRPIAVEANAEWSSVVSLAAEVGVGVVRRGRNAVDAATSVALEPAVAFPEVGNMVAAIHAATMAVAE